jgi:putative MATE family efflux protein
MTEPTIAPVSPRPLWQTYLVILLPMMLTNVLQSVSGTIDGIFLGQFLGVNAIAAVSAFFPVILLLFAIVIGVSSGATVLIGQAWGAGDLYKARAVAITALGMMMIAGVVVSIGGGLLAPRIVVLLGTPPGIQAEASSYARTLLIGTPFIFTLWLVTSMSRGVADAVSPLCALLIATALSAFCTPAFIRGWFGLPQLGVASAPVSTIIASLVALLWLGLHWRRKNHPLAPDFRQFRSIRIDPVLARNILRIGVPMAVQILTMAIAEIVLLGLVNRHGTQATAAYGAINQVMNWVQLPVMSLGITTSILTSHAIGAGRTERISKILRTGLWLNVVTTGSFVLLAYILAGPIIRLFITDSAVVNTATHLLHIVLWSLLLVGATSVLTGVMRASGTVFVPTGLSILAIFAIELPLAYLLNAKVGLSGIWFAYATTFVSILLLQTIFFHFVWRRRNVAALI